MSIKSEILTLQHIRFDLSLKIADIERTIDKVKSRSEGKIPPKLAMSESVCEDLRQLYDETTYELQTNATYTRAYPALCAIGMPDDVKTELLGNEVDTDEDTVVEHGLSESAILARMDRLKKSGAGYENWSPEKLRERAIEILVDDIPF